MAKAKREAGKNKITIDQPNLAVPKRVRRSTLAHTVSIFCALAVIGITGIAAYARVTNDRIVAGVRIANIAVGGLSVDMAQKKLSAAVQNFQTHGATMAFQDVTQTVALQQLGARFDIAGTVNDAYRVGRFTKLGQWILHAFQTSTKIIPVRVTVDHTAFQSFVDDFSKLRSTPVTEPTLAIANGSVSIVPGKDGISVSTAVVPDTLQKAAVELLPIQMTFQSAIEHPKLLDGDLEEAKTTAETMMSGQLTLTYGSRRFVAGKEELQHWIQYAFDPTKIISDPREGITLSLNRELAGAFLSSLNSSVGIPAKPTFGFDAEVLGEYAYKNSQGREVKIDETLEKILPALQDTSPRSVELVVGSSDPPIEKLTAVAPRPTGKVIEVDLSRQALLAFEDGQLKFFTRVSTGLPSHATPTGEWKIYNKTRIQRMVGQGYNLPNVKWVMPYNGDYTLHTAYWHDDFGIPKSHGCTNMAEADAKWLFDWAEIGTPVVIRESSI